MKKLSKEHPLTAFRKANEARQAVVKSSMKKMQTGGNIEYNDYLKAKTVDTNVPNTTELQNSINYWNDRIARNKNFYNEIGPAGSGQVKAPQNNDMENKWIQGYSEQLPRAQSRDNAEKTIRQWKKENPIGKLPVKPVSSFIQKKGGITKTTYKKGGVVQVNTNKTIAKSKKK